MKKYIALVAAGMTMLAGCTTQYQARNYDDVYYSSKNKPLEIRTVVEPQQTPATGSQSVEAVRPAESQQPATADNQGYNEPSYSDTEQYSTPGGDTYITNNYYTDDYYDYAYAARLRRFHNPYCFNSYYSDWYTNMYWYDYNPYSWGMSIYLGYNFWYPSYYYYPSFYRFGWYDWYYPYYGWYDPYPFGYWGGGFYSGYNYGYWNGFYDGYWFGSYNNYYNSHDYNSYYYGHRDDVGRSGSLARNSNYRTFGERYEAMTSADRGRSTLETRRGGGGDANNTMATRNSSGGNRDVTVMPSTGNRTVTSTDDNTRNSGINRGTATTTERQPGNVETGRNSGSGSEPVTRNPQYRYVNPGATNASRQVPQVNATDDNGSNPQQPEIIQQRQQRYANPSSRSTTPSGSQGVQRENNIQPYSPPAYSKPRSSQEYTTPKYRNPGESEVTPQQRSTQATPDQQNRTYTQPSRPAYTPQPSEQRQNKAYQAPPRREESNPRPSRDNSSAPSPGNSTYSAPSRSSGSSGGSYSAPSRSSSSGSSGGSYSAPSRSSSSGSSSSGSSRSSGSSSSGSSGSSGSGHRR